MSNDKADEQGDQTAKLGAVTLLNELLRLLTGALAVEAGALMAFIDESREDVSTETDPRFERVRRLRTMQKLLTDEPDERVLSELHEELSALARENGQS